MTPGRPLCYLLCEGISLRTSMAGWSFTAWRRDERLMMPLMHNVAMFAMIALRRGDLLVHH